MIDALQKLLDDVRNGVSEADDVISTLQTELFDATTKLANTQKALMHAQNVSVFNDLEFTPWLVATGTKANSGSVGSTAGDNQTLPGYVCATRSIAPHGPYADKYWYLELGADAAKDTYEYEASFLFPGAVDSAASQAIELDVQQSIGGVTYNVGLQWDFAENSLRIWDRSSHTWNPTGAPCRRLAPLVWKRAVLEAHREGQFVHYDAVTIDGTRTPLTFVFPAVTLGLGDQLNIGFQIDGNKIGTSYQVALDAFRFKATQKQP